MELVYAGTELGMETLVNPLLNICLPDFLESEVEIMAITRKRGSKLWCTFYGLVH